MAASKEIGRQVWIESCRNELAKAVIGLAYPDRRQVSTELRTLMDRSVSGGFGRLCRCLDYVELPERQFGETRVYREAGGAKGQFVVHGLNTKPILRIAVEGGCNHGLDRFGVLFELANGGQRVVKNTISYGGGKDLRQSRVC